VKNESIVFNFTLIDTLTLIPVVNTTNTTNTTTINTTNTTVPTFFETTVYNDLGEYL
jgi:hypothetical protein